jgi:hypothetical protein
MMIGHVVEAAVRCTAAASTVSDADDRAKEIECLRAALALSDARVSSLIWVLRIVRREVNWGPDSPTLRLVDQSIAGAETPGKAERPPAGTAMQRSV